MAAAMKFFLVIVALVCCMQFVEMSHFRPSEPVNPFELNPYMDIDIDSELIKHVQEDEPEQIQNKFEAGYNNIKEGIEKNFAEMKPEVEAKLKKIKEIMQTLGKSFAEYF